MATIKESTLPITHSNVVGDARYSKTLSRNTTNNTFCGSRHWNIRFTTMSVAGEKAMNTYSQHKCNRGDKNTMICHPQASFYLNIHLRIEHLVISSEFVSPLARHLTWVCMYCTVGSHYMNGNTVERLQPLTSGDRSEVRVTNCLAVNRCVFANKTCVQPLILHTITLFEDLEGKKMNKTNITLTKLWTQQEKKQMLNTNLIYDVGSFSLRCLTSYSQDYSGPLHVV